MIRRGPRAFASTVPMSPSPRPLPQPGPISGPSSNSGVLTEGAAGSTGSGSGAGSSFIASLAVHGLALATLVMTVKVTWRGSSEEPERIVMCALEPTLAPAPVRDDREPPLKIEEPGWESEVPMIEAFEVPEDLTLKESDAASDDIPEYRPPSRPRVRTFDRYAEPTLDLTPKARPKLIRPRSLPADAAPGPLLQPKKPAPLAPTSPAASASPQPIDDACPPPVFPKIARLRSWSGTVYLSIDVSASGAVTAVRIDTSSGHAILDEAAMKAVKTWRFTPAVRGGVATCVTVRKPIEFSLGGA